MEIFDLVSCQNCDWELSYLAMLFSEDFYDWTKLWRLSFE